MSPARLLLLGFTTIFAGFVVVAVGAFQGGSGSGGVFILIGPFPIVFGSGQDSGTLVVLGTVVTVAVILLYLLSFAAWKSRRREADVDRQSE